MLGFLLPLMLATGLCAAPRKEANIVYGMYSGLALLMDVYYPETPNGHGVIFISGSGWHAGQEYGAQPLKEAAQLAPYLQRISEAGYTVFAINHRAAPRFRYPAAVEDAQRAVRFVRHNAGRFQIDPARIGAVGGSSGGHLVSMLGVLDGRGDPQDPDPVNRQSAKVQCVVARAAPADLMKMNSPVGSPTTASFIGMRLPPRPAETSIEYKLYREASPVTHVSPDDPPFLLIHGDADATVPFEQSQLMEAALKKAGVVVKLIPIPGGTHGADFGKPTDAPDYLGQIVRWLDQRLGRQSPPGPLPPRRPTWQVKPAAVQSRT